MCEVGDTPSCYIRAEYLQDIWNNTVSKNHESGFEEFRYVFSNCAWVVAPTATVSSSPARKRSEEIEEIWEWQIDMDYIPREALELRTESQSALLSWAKRSHNHFGRRFVS
jgi:hypothetical protein